MANIFAISTITTELKADAAGRATALFTVTNTQNKPVRGIALARALGSTRQEWLSTDGETERDFSAGGTQQFTVTFTRPPSPPLAGATAPIVEKFPFRLDIASSANPDEHFTEGPPVSVEVTTQPTLPPTKPFPWWIVAIVCAALLVITLVIFLLVRTGGGGSNNSPPPSPAPAVVSFEGRWQFADMAMAQRPTPQRIVFLQPAPRFIVEAIEIRQSGEMVRARLICGGFCERFDEGEGRIFGDSVVINWRNHPEFGATMSLRLLDERRLRAEGTLFSRELGNPTIRAIYRR